MIRATGPGAPKVLMVLTPGARGLQQELGVPRAFGSRARALVMGTAPSRDSDRARAKLPAIKGSGCHLVPVICGPAFLTRRLAAATPARAYATPAGWGSPPVRSGRGQVRRRMIYRVHG